MGNAERISLTPAEWNLMEFLWENNPATGRETAEYFKKHTGWSRTTTLTILRHVVDKGAVSCDESGAKNIYVPLIDREEAMAQETGDFLKRIYNGSVSLMLSTLTKKQELSEEEIKELKEILRKAEGSDLS